ncbi:uncharacterized protein Z519_07265 [Cladophialophora bantiana CBS 173.52]|uniref:Transcription factor domain-containing protein n=1 Tax=Cladophialophora bantiana (strain ATCC 10958 / CBS 173.52 / CDC B-1940 / NIH 8579) TaxID=1442370 RepID=A0A0D2EQR2_CLAB1|nr:uncharacterized protein Z519_07265 [Cladophialophora bantiana CBS 173.52]KIW92281.1 hypothetical protein Z519_07265 [Cladophialophora bantiana CBS 173.52]
MPFIVSAGGKKKDDPETRKLIRSHVMLGKNLGKSRGRAKPKDPLPWEVAPAWNSFDGGGAAIQQPSSIIPKKVGSEWSFTQLAAEIEPAAIADILTYSSLARQATVPLEACISFDKKDRVLVGPMASDAAFVHAAALGTHAYVGLMLGREDHHAVQSTSPHFSKALQLLRERLDSTDEDLKVANPTIMVVIALALHARMIGDFDSAKHHMEGLRMMINLRGGITTVIHKMRLAMEIFRCDIGLAIESGSKPVFFSNTSPREPFLPFPDRMSRSMPKSADMPSFWPYSEQFLSVINEEIAIVWRAMKRFCLQISRAARTKRKLSEEILLQATASIMYRLLHMSFASGSLDAAIRLGLVAFSSQIFLQLPDVGVRRTSLSTTYQECLVGLDILEEQWPQLLLWLLMVGAVAVFNEPGSAWLKPWLKSTIERCAVDSWSDFRDMMDSFMWIGLVFDKPAKDIFYSAMTSLDLSGDGSASIASQAKASPAATPKPHPVLGVEKN